MVKKDDIKKAVKTIHVTINIINQLKDKEKYKMQNEPEIDPELSSLLQILNISSMEELLQL